MAYVDAVTWRAREGEEETIGRILATVVPRARAEACWTFQAHRPTESGYQANVATDAFRRHVLGDAVPRLEHRDRAFYVTMD